MINHSLIINQPSCQPCDFPVEGAFLPLAWRKSSVLEGALPSTAPGRFNPFKLVELKLLKRRVPLETVETKVVLLQKWVFCKKAWVENPGYFTVFWCFVYGTHHFGMNAGIKYLLFSIAQKILFDSTTATKLQFGRRWSMTPEAYQSIGRCGRSSGYFHLIGNILICCIDQTCKNCPPKNQELLCTALVGLPGVLLAMILIFSLPRCTLWRPRGKVQSTVQSPTMDGTLNTKQRDNW